VTRKTCKHALAWILSNRGIGIQDYVHEDYLVARFRAAYEDRVEPIPDRSQCLVVKLGFKVYPSLLGRRVGRPRVVRIRGCLEKRATKKKVRCKRCGDFGHFAKIYKEAELGEDGERGQGSSKRYYNYFCVCHFAPTCHLPKLTKLLLCLQSRKRPIEDDAGPSQVKKFQKKISTIKKKTPIKKKIKKAAAAPPTTVVSSIRQLVFDSPQPTNP
jgi:hypothetical protein